MGSEGSANPTGEGASAAAPGISRSRGNPLAEFFLLRGPLAEAAHTELVRGSPGYDDFVVSQALFRDATMTLDRGGVPWSVLVLLGESIRRSARALALHRGAAETAGDTIASLGLGPAVNAVWEQIPAVQRTAVERAILHQLPPESPTRREVAQTQEHATRLAAELLAELSRCRVRTRGLLRARRLRIGAALGLMLAVACVAARRAGPHNVARRAKVTVSSESARYGVPIDRAVDGDRNELGFHTNREARPWVMLDLGTAHPITTVTVFNRPGENTARAVPLLVEVSTDGTTFTTAAERREDFKTWTASLPTGTVARYVRLTARPKKTTFLHLAEIEVY